MRIPAGHGAAGIAAARDSPAAADRSARSGDGSGGVGPASPSPAGRLGRLTAGLAGAALLIAALTLLSRVVGFGRWVVFSRTVGAADLADAYNTANNIPNIVFNIVAGGALAGVAVPLLAGPLARGARDEAARVVSAMLTWVLLILTPLAALGMVFAHPLGDLLAGGHSGDGAYAATVGSLLRAFFPQLPLYGVAVVLSAALQADRRFLAPALAPLLSSLVVIGGYLAFSDVNGAAAAHLGQLRHSGEMLLALGTTGGVLVLAVTPVPAVLHAGLRPRPTLRFPSGFAGRARALALAGVATLAAQQAANLVIVRLTNSHFASPGSLTIYTFVLAVYLLPYAVLAVPIATSAFTELSARYESGERDRYTAVAAATTRLVLLVACAGAAVLVAVAWPASRMFAGHLAGGRAVTVAEMAHGLIAFAPGLLGYAFTSHLANVLYAAERGRAAATAIVTGWIGVIAADILLVPRLPRHQTVTALGLGNLAGMTLAGALLLAAVGRVAGAGALRGMARAAVAGALGMAAAAGAGTGLAAAIGPTGSLVAIPVALLAAGVAVAVFAVAVLVLDGADLRDLLARRPARG